MEFFTDEIPGSKRSMSPEGFMICKDVPLSRTGTQVYSETELPDIVGNQDGLVLVQRDAAEVFHPSSISSLNGKPVTVEHPGDLEVNPDNVAEHQVGFVTNVRRGSPPQDNVLLGDLVVTHRKGIDAIRSGIRGISVGYQCNYVQYAPGRARQHGIIANHVALTDRPRCGATCMIGDSQSRHRTVVDRATTTMLRAKATAERTTMRNISVRNKEFWSQYNA
jgi:hypothetical protein